MEGPIKSGALGEVPQGAKNRQHPPLGNPGYRLMFCLRSQDNGRADNPALQAMVDDRDRPLTFASVGAAMQYQARLGRISADLVYYAVESGLGK